MKNLFHIDGPFFQLMERIADFLIINIFTILCCLPLFTAGAALAANHKVMQNTLAHNDQPVVRVFFSAFRKNFKQSTIIWLLAMLIVAFLIGDFLIVHNQFAEAWKTPLFILLGLISFVVLGSLSYVLPLIVRYENTLKAHILNSVFLAVSHIPRTAIMVSIYVFPILTIFSSYELFYSSLFFWISFGISIIIYLQTCLIKPVFTKLETATLNDGVTVS